MTKNDLKLIHAFIDKGNPKLSLNYAMLGHDGIYATDTRKAIKFHIPMLECNNFFANKKVVNCLASCLGKEDSAKINAEGVAYYGAMDRVSLDNVDEKLEPTNFKLVLEDQEFEYKFMLDSLDDIHFELTQKECFVDDFHLMPIVEFSSCNRYQIFFNKQKFEDGTTNTGLVKIIGLYDTEDETDLIKFTAVVIGREFKTQAKEQLLFDV